MAALLRGQGYDIRLARLLAALYMLLKNVIVAKKFIIWSFFCNTKGCYISNATNVRERRGGVGGGGVECLRFSLQISHQALNETCYFLNNTSFVYEASYNT